MVLARLPVLGIQGLILVICAVWRLAAMPNTQSPYIAFAMLLSSNGHPVTGRTARPADCRSCAGAGFDADGWLADAAQLLETEPGDTVRNALVGLQEMVKGELTSDDMAIVLLLPSDDAALADRATALGSGARASSPALA